MRLLRSSLDDKRVTSDTRRDHHGLPSEPAPVEETRVQILHRLAAFGAALIIGAAGLAACGANDAGAAATTPASGGRQDHRPAAAGVRRPPATRRSTGRCSRPRSRSCAPTARSTTTTPTRTRPSRPSRSTPRSRGRRRHRARPGQRRRRRRHGRRPPRSQDVPVIAYDRFIDEADYYMSFDNETVGKMQAEALVDAMGDKGGILMLNGAPSDPNAAQFKAGAHSVLDGSGVEDPRGVRQPRLEPRERPAVDHRPAEQVRRLGRSRASTPPTTARPAASSPR